MLSTWYHLIKSCWFMAWWASLVTQMVKNLPAVWETEVCFLDWEDPLEKRMSTHSIILAWRISWTEEPGRLWFIGSQRVGYNWSDLAAASAAWWMGFPGCTRGKKHIYQWPRYKRRGFEPWVGKIPWRRTGQPAPVFFPGESHGQRSLAVYGL